VDRRQRKIQSVNPGSKKAAGLGGAWFRNCPPLWLVRKIGTLVISAAPCPSLRAALGDQLSLREFVKRRGDQQQAGGKQHR
jgi:hypothetical protein